MRSICCAILALWFAQSARDFAISLQSKYAILMYLTSYLFVGLAIIGCVLGI